MVDFREGSPLFRFSFEKRNSKFTFPPKSLMKWTFWNIFSKENVNRGLPSWKLITHVVMGDVSVVYIQYVLKPMANRTRLPCRVVCIKLKIKNEWKSGVLCNFALDYSISSFYGVKMEFLCSFNWFFADISRIMIGGVSYGDKHMPLHMVIILYCH